MLGDEAMDVLFRQARSQNGFLDRPVAPQTLRALYELMKFGPTSANCSPLRAVFLVSPEAKRKLLPSLSPGNVDKTMSAPVVAVLGYDLGFFRHAEQLFPHRPAMFDAFAQDPELARTTALRNGTLQAAYLMLAARSLGLDCGPMSGFDEAAVQRMFFGADEQVRVNFLCNLGYGDPAKVFPRLPRLAFDAACRIA
jgi:3-hydroxypropanoate dehydrogenase